MKTNTATQHLTVNAILKFLSSAFKNFFQSPSHRDFKRLKDFISS
jgi:hypothetical protein